MATVRAALAEAEALGPTVSAERVAAAAAFGALMGARGNSGVITSQILRGLAEGLAGKTKFNALDLANALDQGTKAAYGAVAKPVEGTILTVIREASAAAVVSAERERTPRRRHGARPSRPRRRRSRRPRRSWRSCARPASSTPAGRACSGCSRARTRFLTGDVKVRRRGCRAPPAAAAGGRQRARPSTARPPAPACATRASASRRCSWPWPRPESRSTSTAIRDYLESIGESVLVAGDARAIKVHIHNERPDQVLAYAPRARDALEDHDREPRPPGRGRPRDARGGVRGRGGPRSRLHGRRRRRHAGDGRRTARLPEPRTRPALAVVAVAAGEGLAAIFRDFGVHKVVYGGQTANPSTGELLEAVKAVDAHEVLLLPNNPNIVLAARQVAAMSDRPVAVVATRNAAEGFAALLALDPDKGAVDNATAMTAAGRAIQSLSVTEAVRDATVSGRKVKQGQTIALDPDDGLVAVHDDPATAVLDAIKALSPGFELITVYYGDGGDLAGTEALARDDPRPRDRRGGRGPPRRPAALPLPDLGRVGGVGERESRAAKRGAQGTGDAARPDPGRPLLDDAARPSPASRAAPAARTGRAGGSGVATVRDLLFHLPRRYDDLREMRKLGDLAWLEDGEVVSARVTVADIRVEASFRRRVQRTIAVLEDETGTHRGDVVRAALHRAPAPPGRAGHRVRQAQALRPEADARQPGLPARGQRGRAAPRRADRARLPADRRAHRGDAPAGRARGARPRRPATTPSTCRRPLRDGDGVPPIGERARGGPLPDVVRAPRRGARAAGLRRAARAPARAWSGGAGSGGAIAARPVEVDDATDAELRAAPSRRRCGRSSAARSTLTADQDAAIRDIRADLARADADAPPAPGRRRLGQDRGRGVGARGRGARPAARRRSSRPTDLLARQHHRTLTPLLEDAGLPVELLTGSLTRRRRAPDARARRVRAWRRSSSGRTP